MKISICDLTCRLLFLTFTVVFAASPVLAGKRVALVIGNSAYENTATLKNPVNDANLMASSLKKAGFEVTKLLDADYRTLKRAMLTFGRKLRNSPEAGLFYYAGHGIQVRGKNYLVPVNAKISDEDEVDLEAIDVNAFLRIMESSDSDINIVVLDACRNNPFARSFRSAEQGLATLDAPKGTFIAYATAPGSVASDGQGKNSPYTVALSKAIEAPGLTIEEVFKATRVSVLNQTSSKQIPWETSSIIGDFFFHNKKQAALSLPVLNTPIVQLPVISSNNLVRSVSNEAENVYKQIKDSQNIDVLEIFAEQFPNSIYTKFVRVRIKILKENNISKTTVPKNDNPVNHNNQANEDLGPIQLARNVQSELNRLGCEAGNADGKWDFTSRQALEQYRLHSSEQLVSMEPSTSLLNKLREHNSRICPLNCRLGYIVVDNRCVRTTPESQIVSQECKKLYVDFKKNGPIRAFAISADGDTCGTSWNYNTKSEASKNALSYCKSEGGKGCKILTISKPASRPQSKECKDLFTQWKEQNGSKAFALSGSGQACGYGAEYDSKTAATDRALKECKQQGEGCHIIASKS